MIELVIRNKLSSELERFSPQNDQWPWLKCHAILAVFHVFAMVGHTI